MAKIRTIEGCSQQVPSPLGVLPRRVLHNDLAAPCLVRKEAVDLREADNVRFNQLKSSAFMTSRPCLITRFSEILTTFSPMSLLPTSRSGDKNRAGAIVARLLRRYLTSTEVSPNGLGDLFLLHPLLNISLFAK